MIPVLPAQLPVNRFLVGNVAFRSAKARDFRGAKGDDLVFYLVEALILMSTPAGRLSLLRASIVLAVAWTISINLL